MIQGHISKIYIPPLPTNTEAHRIWLECYLGDYAIDEGIENALTEWIYFNTDMRERVNHRNEIELNVTWIDQKEVRYSMTWNAFLRWFRMSCRVLE